MKRMEQRKGRWWDRGWLFLGAAVFALALTACGGGGGGGGGGGPASSEVPVNLGQPGPGDAGNHFPFTVGNFWAFQVTGVETGLPAQTFVSTSMITGTRQVVGVDTTVFQETNPDGTNVPGNTFLVKDLNGIADFGNDDPTDTLTPQIVPVWDIRFPLAAGASFVSLDRNGVDFDDLDGDGIGETGDLRSVVTVRGLETVTVPVGTFADCARIERTLTLTATLTGDGSRVTATQVDTGWFAPGVGPVKELSVFTFPAGGFTETDTEELIGFSVDGQTRLIRIEVTPATGTMSVGGSLQVTAAAINPAGASVGLPPLGWLSSNPTVAMVDANGLVRGVGAGSAVITAGLVQGPFSLHSNPVEVTVTAGAQPPVQQLTTIQVSPSPVPVATDGTVQLTATGLDQFGSIIFGLTFTWQSGNSAVASVDANGLVTGVAPGSTTITASAGGIISPSVPVTVSDVRQIALATNDLVFDPFTLRVYASVPSRAGVNGNSVAVINPETGQVESFIPVGSEPKKLALSDDGRFLYVAQDATGSVARLDLNNPAAPVLDLTFALGSDSSLGPFFVEDMEVMPGERRTVAISRMFKTVTPKHAGVAIFDDGVQRPVTTPGHTGSNAIEFSANPGLLYGYNNETTEFGFRRMAVEAGGVTVLTVDSSFTSDLVSGFADIEFAGGLLFATTGRMVDPEARTLVGTVAGISFGAQLEPDAGTGRVFFLSSDFVGLAPWQISAFAIPTLIPLGAEDMPAFTGTPGNLIRWGPNGLAFGTTGDQVVLVRSSLIP